jgi:hypothetical protein
MAIARIIEEEMNLHDVKLVLQNPWQRLGGRRKREMFLDSSKLMEIGCEPRVHLG